MDFGILPPEVTSALIHSGPGAWSWIAAAAAWEELSAELEQSADGYSAELAWLSTTYHGPSSLTMAQAFEPYLAWLRTTAVQCREIATSAEVMTAAFELTHWTVVHPSVVAANRARLAMLLATNFFGINYPAIAETEAEYHAMWVNNSAALVRYDATSASTVRPPAFEPPPPVSDPSGPAREAAMVPATNTANVGTQTAAAFAGTSQDLAASSAFGLDPDSGWFRYFSVWGWQFIAGGFPVNLLSYLAQLNAAQSLTGGVATDIFGGLSEAAADLSAADASLVSAVGSSVAPQATLGVGISLGNLTMPPATVGMLGSSAPVQLASAVSALPPGAGQTPMLPMVPMRPTRGATNGQRRKGRYDDIEYGAELPGTVMHRPPSAG